MRERAGGGAVPSFLRESRDGSPAPGLLSVARRRAIPMESVRKDGQTGHRRTDELRDLVVEVLERLERDGPGALDEACT